MKTPAARLLDAARAATPDAPTGVACMAPPADRSCGTVLVTWHRVADVGDDPHPSHVYDVGTAAMNIARGHRAHVEPYIRAMLAGCVTVSECQRWIAARAAA